MWTILESSTDKTEHLPELDEPLVLGSETATTARPLWLRVLTAAGWMSGIVLLCIALAAQYAWFNREQVLENPTWRQGWQLFCQYSGCEVPPAENAQALRSVLLDVSPHPEWQDVLQIHFRIQNTLQVPQSFPAVELSFSNTQNETIAARRFYPGHYLHRDIFAQRFLRPAAEVDGVLEILNPGDDAVNYAIQFVYEKTDR